MKKLLLCVLATIATTSAFAEDRFASVQIETIPVAGSVYMLTGAGGNIGVSVGDDGMLMVDDQYAPLSDKIKAALAALGTDTPDFILNTHYHGDHMGGNINFPDSVIMAHDNVRARLVLDTQLAPGALPVMTYSDRMSVHYNGGEIQLIHQPTGHTDGDTVVYFTAENVIHMGDNFFADRFPYVDLDAGGSVNGLILNIRETLQTANDDTLIIPGHGDLATPADLKRYLGMLEQTSGFVRSQMSEGMSLGEIIEAGLPATWEDWAWGFITEERWITTLYREHAS